MEENNSKFGPPPDAYADPSLDLDPNLVAKAKEGYSFAQLDIGKSYYSTTNLTDKLKNAFDWFMLAAQQRNTEAQFRLGDMYALGEGVEKNEFTAYDWYLKSALQGYPKALTRIHNLYHYEKSMRSRGLLNSKEEKWMQDDLKKNNNVREVPEYRALQLGSQLIKIEEYFAKLSATCRNIDDQDESDKQQQSNLVLGFLFQHGYGVKKSINRAMELYQLAAEKGNVDAQYNLGLLYQKHSDKRCSYREAYKWSTLAAKNGSIEAQENLAFLYLKGLGTDVDYSKVLYWYGRAAEGRNVKAQISLACIYRNGTIVDQNYEKAIYWYKKAIEEDSTVAQNCLEQLYSTQISCIDSHDFMKDAPPVSNSKMGVRSRFRKRFSKGKAEFEKIKKRVKYALKGEYNTDVYPNETLNQSMLESLPRGYSKKSLCSRLRADISEMAQTPELEKLKKRAMCAFKGDANAMLEFGLKYYRGNQFTRDREIAFRWIRNAAKAGSTDAQLSIAKMYKDGDCVEQDYHAASIWYHKAAKNGNGEAQYYLGMMYLEGLGVQQNYLQANRWFKLGADNNNSNARVQLDILQKNGRGLRQDLLEAIHSFTALVQQSNPEVLDQLALMYDDTVGVELDTELGLSVHDEAAHRGNQDSQIKLGNFYSNRDSSAFDMEKAVRYYTLASNQGNSHAKYRLAILCLEGRVASPSFLQAYDFFKEASDLGNSNAANIFSVPIDYSKSKDVDYFKIMSMFEFICERNIDSLEYNLARLYQKSFTYIYNNSVYTIIADESMSKRFYEAAAEKNVPEAQYNLGVIYEEGEKTALNLSKAVEYYIRAHGNGYVDATYKLASMYLDGHVASQNLQRAFHLYNKASDMGHKEAYKILHLPDENLHQEKFRSVREMITEMAESGNVISQYQLGCAMLSYKLVQHRNTDSIRWLTLASQGGHTDASYLLGSLYDKGEVVEQDYEKAFQYYQMAADKGKEHAFYRLAQLYQIIEEPRRDYAKAFELYSLAAKKGNPRAQFLIHVKNKTDWEIGRNRLNGFSNSKQLSYNNFLQMWEYVASKGNSGIQYELGQMYQGEGEHSNPVLAVKWYLEAAKLSHSNAIYCLGVMHEQGQGIDQDCVKATEYYEKSGTLNNMHALYRLGLLYLDGEIVPKDSQRALNYLKRAAKEGHSAAMFTLGKIFEEGQITKENKLQALKYYNMSASKGHIDALNHIDKQYGEIIPNNALYYTLRRWHARILRHTGSPPYFQSIDFKSISTLDNQLEEYIFYSLGCMHYYGYGTSISYTNAWECFTIAKLLYGSNRVTDLLTVKYNNIDISMEIEYLKKVQMLEMVTQRLTYEQVYELGLIYYRGVSGVPNKDKLEVAKVIVKPNKSKASRYFAMIIGKKSPVEEEVDRDYTNASYYLGMIHYINFIRNNKENNFDYYLRNTSSAKYPDYEALRDSLKDSHKSKSKVHEKVLDWHIANQSSENNNITYNLGWMFSEGFGTKIDLERSFSYYKIAASKGHIDAKFQLGFIYENGYGIPRSYGSAIDSYRGAVAQNHVGASFKLGEMYFYGIGAEINHSYAFKLYKTAANFGYSKAQYQLGLFYANGYGTERNYQKALEWYTKAADQDQTDANFNLGQIYFDGEITNKDYKKAFHYYKLAADKGHSDAQFQLGSQYFLGLGVEKSYINALEWYTRAAEQNHTEASFNLGQTYFYSISGDQNITKSYWYYVIAADKEHAEAQFQLGSIYEYGLGVEIDYRRAVWWYTRAASNHHSEANFKLKLFKQNSQGDNGMNGVSQTTKQVTLKSRCINIKTKESSTLCVNLLKSSNNDEYNPVLKGSKTKRYFENDNGEESLPHYRISNIESIQFLAENSDMEAEFALAEQYIQGQNIPQDTRKAFDWYMKSALHGYPKALSKIYRLYHQSDKLHRIMDMKCYSDTKKDDTNKLPDIKKYFSAELILYQKANPEDWDSQQKLGFLYQHGFCVKKSSLMAIEYYKSAAKKGLVGAQLNLGYLYQNHEENEYSISAKEKNYKEAFKWYVCATKSDNNVAQNHLAYMYLNGFGVRRDLRAALNLYKISASGGNIHSQLTLAKLCRTGKYVTLDLFESVNWYNMAARQGSKVAKNCIYMLKKPKWKNQSDSVESRAFEISRYFTSSICLKLREDVDAIAFRENYEKLKLLSRNALVGDGLSMFRIGLNYCDGIDFPKNEEVGFKWIAKAAKTGYHKAQYTLGTKYEMMAEENNLGNGSLISDQYFFNASIWYKKAAEQDNSEAQCSLGILYEHGFGVVKNLDCAEEWYTKSAEGKNPEGQYHLGISIFSKTNPEDHYKEYRALKTSDTKTKRTMEKAIHLIRESHLQDNPEAVYMMGLLYENGVKLPEKKNKFILINPNRQSAEKYYESAIRIYKERANYPSSQLTSAIIYTKNNMDFACKKWTVEQVTSAQLVLARIYSGQFHLKHVKLQNLVIQKNNDSSAKYYKMATDNGDSTARYELACLKLDESKTKQDFEKCYKLFQMTNETGRLDAKILFDPHPNRFTTIDPDQFLQMLLNNVDMGYAIVEYQLGYFYEHGSSIIGSSYIKKSYPQAIEHYKKAAEAGYSYAQHQLGNIYERGKGVSRDLEKAFHFYNQASTNGHKDSAYRLACMYYNGEGTEKKMFKAFKLYKQAAEGGNLFAEEALDIDVSNNSYDYNNFLKKLEMYEVATREYHYNFYMLALVYEDKNCPFYDLKKATEYYDQAVEFNIVEALYRLGILYEDEIKEEEYDINPLEISIQYYQKYIRTTTTVNGDAMYRLALLYLHHTNDKKNYIGAFDLLTKAHGCGFVRAEKVLNLSQKIYIGKNTILAGEDLKTYHEEIIKMYEAVAAQGNISAQYKLGILYEDNLSVQDYLLAEKWYSKAAKSGHKNASYRLGKLYQEGKGVEKNSEMSTSFYIKAAEAGCEKSLSQLGTDIIINKSDANFKLESRMNHFRKLASTGNAAAQCTLGCFYLIKDNLLDALRWLSRSYLLGNDDPSSILASKCYHENESNQYERKKNLLEKLIKTRPGFAYYEIATLHYNRTRSLNNLSLAFKNYWIAANKFNNKKAEKYIRINMRNTLPPEENEKLIEMFVKAANEDSKDPKNSTWISEAQYQLGLYNQEKYKDLADSTDEQKSYDGNNIYLNNAIEYLQNAAKHSHVKAAYELSMIYLEEQKFDKAKDYLEKANDYSEKATKKKDKKATYQLGKLYLEHDQDLKIGLRYLKESAELGNPSANNELGLIYKSGEKSLNQDYRLSFEAFQKAAESEHPESQFNLGLLYQTGKGVEKNEYLALQWYIKSAQNGNKLAGFQVAMMHMKGEGTFQNKKRALEYLEKYSDGNDPEVIYYLSQLNERKGDTKISMLQRSAEAGNNKAQYDLGLIYMMGDDAVQDYNEAFKYMHDAAKNGNAEAKAPLGWLYENGKGIERNIEAAINCYKNFNQTENKEIQYKLGILQKFRDKPDRTEMLSYLKKAADRGHCDAKYQLGLLYEYGKDFPAAYKLYRQASEQGNTEVDYRFGLMYMNGEYLERDYSKAIEHFKIFECQHSYRFNYSADVPDMGLFTEADSLYARELYEKGEATENSDLLYKLASIYRNNEKDQNNSIISNVLFFQAAKKGHCEAELELGLIYVKEQNIDEANRWINNAITHGSVRAKNFLGYMVANNKIFGQNTSKALQYFNDAATLGNRDAQFNIGSIYHYGKWVEKDTEKAIKWYNQSADQGCIASQFALGLIYKSQEDYLEAFNYFKKAAEQNHGDSQYFLGWMYENGFGTEKDMIQADKWYTKSEFQESHSCSIFLAELYHCNNDTVTALKWYKKALDSKYTSFAERGLGLIHEYGHLIERDYEKAFQCYKKSAEKRNVAAYYDLGRMYYYGKGVERNIEEATTWFEKAIGGARNDAMEHVLAISKENLTSDTYEQEAAEYLIKPEKYFATKAQSYLDVLKYGAPKG